MSERDTNARIIAPSSSAYNLESSTTTEDRQPDSSKRCYQDIRCSHNDEICRQAKRRNVSTSPMQQSWPQEIKHPAEDISGDVNISGFSDFDKSFVARISDSAVLKMNNVGGNEDSNHFVNTPTDMADFFLREHHTKNGHEISPFHSISSIGTNNHDNIANNYAGESDPLPDVSVICGKFASPYNVSYGSGLPDNIFSLASPLETRTSSSKNERTCLLVEGVHTADRKTTRLPKEETNTIVTPTFNADDQTSQKKWSRWTKEEDQLLRNAVEIEGQQNWKLIAEKYFPGTRKGIQCKNRWRKALQPGLIKGRWSADEDQIIIDCINGGLTKWADIATRLQGRIGEQIKERWFNVLDPSIKRGVWSEVEIEILNDAREKMGNCWSKIAKLLPGRSENAVKNKWYNAQTSKKRAMENASNEFSE